MAYKISYSCLTHVGKIRKINQDNYICEGKYFDVYQEEPTPPFSGSLSSDRPSMIGVFDGMGGEECGEIASLIASKSAAETVIGEKPLDDLKDFCMRANDRICEFSEENNISYMGTTAALLVFAKKDIFLCNIGDSKVFQFSNDHLEQISVDHYALTAPGRKPPLSQNLGIPADEMLIEPYYGRGSYRDGDIYLICSDGLTDMVQTEEIEQILSGFTFDAAAGRLLNAALENGGRDNITIVLCRVEREHKGLLHQLFQSKQGKRRHEQ